MQISDSQTAMLPAMIKDDILIADFDKIEFGPQVNSVCQETVNVTYNEDINWMKYINV